MNSDYAHIQHLDLTLARVPVDLVQEIAGITVTLDLIGSIVHAEAVTRALIP